MSKTVVFDDSNTGLDDGDRLIKITESVTKDTVKRERYANLENDLQYLKDEKARITTEINTLVTYMNDVKSAGNLNVDSASA